MKPLAVIKAFNAYLDGRLRIGPCNVTLVMWSWFFKLLISSPSGAVIAVSLARHGGLHAELLHQVAIVMGTIHQRVVSAYAVAERLRLRHEPQGELLGKHRSRTFFVNLKMEQVWQRQYASYVEVKVDITDCIVGFYNCKRLNSALGNPPAVFEWKMAIQESIVVSEFI